MTPYHQQRSVTLYHGDCRLVLPQLPPKSIQTCVTSPPYWGLRDYGVNGQIGLEDSLQQYTQEMVQVFREVRRCLRDDGTLWLNLGDGYTSGGRNQWRSGASDNKGQQVLDNANHRPKTPQGLKPKDLCGIPWRVAFALQDDGWFLRQDIIWHKPNPMPESVTDRCTKAHEYLFLLSKSQKYHYDAETIREEWTSGRDDMRKHGVRTGAAYLQQNQVADNTSKDSGKVERNQHDCKTGRNKRSVWTVPTQPYKNAHFATFPTALITPCILAGCPEKATVLDPFVGSGTTALVAKINGRKSVGIELNKKYLEMAAERVKNVEDCLF